MTRAARRLLAALAATGAVVLLAPVAKAVDVTVPPVAVTVPPVDTTVASVPVTVPQVPVTVPPVSVTVPPATIPSVEVPQLPVPTVTIPSAATSAVPSATVLPTDGSADALPSTETQSQAPLTLAAATRRATGSFAVPLLMIAAVGAYVVVRAALDRRDARLARVQVSDRWVRFR